MPRPLWIPWRWWRRAVQLALLIGFCWLFRRTEYVGSDLLAGGENVLFRLDPLAAAAAMLAARQFISLFWPALVLVGLTLLLGRFFCGWICPLGTLLDYFHRLISGPLSLWERVRVRAAQRKVLLGNFTKQPSPPTPLQKREGRFFRHSLTSVGRAPGSLLLIVVLVAAVFAFPLVGFIDPFSLLVRAMTYWGDPMLYHGTETVLCGIGGWSEEVLFPWAKDKHILPFRAMVFHLAETSAAILGVIFLLEFAARRFWCRYLCPAGAMLGFFARRSLVKRLPVKVCKSCDVCTNVCRMAAIDSEAGISPQACTLCMDCVDFCPKGIAKLGLGPKARGRRSFFPIIAHDSQSVPEKRPPSPSVMPRSVDLSRRGVLAGIAAGAAIPGVALAARCGHARTPPPHLLRPPGTADEKTFLGLCVRCGECMKVCPTNVLQPAIFEAGLEGMFSPRMIPRLIREQSYCEYTCTLCGQVCPSGAIPPLTEEEKHQHPTGKAYFDHALCLPWAEKTPCIRCEEMCPAPEKAIKILNTFKIKDKDGREVEIQQPYVDRDLCVGCGICESNCTIAGVSAIRVQRLEAPDPGTEFLLQSSPNKPAKGTNR